MLTVLAAEKQPFHDCCCVFAFLHECWEDWSGFGSVFRGIGDKKIWWSVGASEPLPRCMRRE